MSSKVSWRAGETRRESVLRGIPWELTRSEEMNNRGDTSEAPKTSVTNPASIQGWRPFYHPVAPMTLFWCRRTECLQVTGNAWLLVKSAFQMNNEPFLIIRMLHAIICCS